MGPEIWFRNIGNYVRELIATAHVDVAFDRGYTAKRSIDPAAFMRAWMPPHLNHWRCLHIGDQGSPLYVADQKDPVAVYPTWQYGVDTLDLLIWMLENPAGADPEPYTIENAKIDEIPVEGQEHRIILTDLPSAVSAKEFYRVVAAIQNDYQDAIIHVHGTYAFATMFRLGFRAFDFDASGQARGGVDLPLANGKRMSWRDMQDGEPAAWVRTLGIRPRDLAEPRWRCIYVIKAMKYAAANWDQPGRGSSKALAEEPDVATPTASWKPNIIRQQGIKQTGNPADMIACDICSLADSCHAYRPGSVCTLPKSHGSELAKFFKTRDSGTIIQGLQELIEIQAGRLERGINWELGEEELSPEVTKLVDGLFQKGVSLAKLVDPKLGKGPLVAIQNNVGNAEYGARLPTANTPAQLVAQAKAELEQAGYKSEELTYPMIEEYMKTSILPRRELDISEADVVDE